jgi:hypothetical protein
MQEISHALVAVSPFVFAIVAIWLAYLWKMNRARFRAEMQRELISKFSSGQELKEFLAGEGGRLFVDLPSTNTWSKRRVISLAVAGLIASGAGVGFLFEDKDAGHLFIGVGLALLVSAAVSNWLANRMGLSEQASDSAAPRPPKIG